MEKGRVSSVPPTTSATMKPPVISPETPPSTQSWGRASTLARRWRKPSRLRSGSEKRGTAKFLFDQ